MSLLSVQDLTIRFGSHPVVDRLSFEVDVGERVAVIGESGSGKSMTCLAVLGLLPRGASVSGRVLLDGVDLLRLRERDLDGIRGREIGCVFQEPQTALNPVMTVGRQLTTALRRHTGLSRSQARDAAVELATLVDLPTPADTVRRYPHELSGGQRQRVVIAMAMSCRPRLLLADEPTTALDSTVQARVLDLLLDLTLRQGTGVVLVTHDLAVAAQTSERLVVMRHGRVVETGRTADVLAVPQEAYTAQLLAAARDTSLLSDPATTGGAAR